MRVVLLDNRDSFVYNLVDQFASSGASIEVYRNTVEAGRILDALAPPHDDGTGRDRPILVLSPGPGHPAEAGCLMELLDAALSRAIPTLGICLGFQALVTACAGAVARISPVHGKSTRVELTEEGRADPVLSQLHEPLHVARYHSLGTRRLPAALVPLARTPPEDPAGPGVVMAARHRRLPALGLQFHPESLLTPQGPALLTALTEELAQSGAEAPRTRPGRSR
ncbi:anthranilate synthase component II [Schaalia hyovaginalis]|uniref:anthranilate synthase component II n=1 Tax=Schaalia hyovaginalis TaxID=29316 RepID=UPI00139AE2D3|nr:gamma-glutamyl-gamma-aminobutyrate hydrolase family protein [Schaalia hyovaginalis]MST64336.1 aminodeoxychorismate/anthranilate synthase component II [Schaalia hyovaginalis]